LPASERPQGTGNQLHKFGFYIEGEPKHNLTLKKVTKFNEAWEKAVDADAKRMHSLAPRRKAAFTLSYILGAWVTGVAHMAYSCNPDSWPVESLSSDLLKVAHVKLVFTRLVEFGALSSSCT